MKVKSLSHVQLFATPWTVTRFLNPWDFPGKNTGVGCHFLLQEIFPTQGLNPGLSHCRQTFYRLSHQMHSKQYAKFTSSRQIIRINYSRWTDHPLLWPTLPSAGCPWLFWNLGISVDSVPGSLADPCFLTQGSHFFFVCVLVAQSCPTLCDPTDCSPPGSPVHGIFQARVLEWVAISFSRESSLPRDWTQVSHIVDRCFTVWAKARIYLNY